MRPYFAIIKDSFRAAMASRVLYVLLILITLLLMVIAPLHKKETLDWELRERVSVRSPARLLRLIVEKHESSEPIGRVWGLLPESLQKGMLAIIDRPDEGGGRYRDFRHASEYYGFGDISTVGQCFEHDHRGSWFLSW